MTDSKGGGDDGGMTAWISAALLFAPAQDAPSFKEQEAIVREYLTSENPSIELLDPLEGVSFPDKRAMKKWAKVMPSAIEDRIEARPVAKKAGEHRDGQGRYFLGGEMKKPKALFVGLHGGGEGSGDAGGSHGNWNAVCKECGMLGLFPEVLEKTERGWTDSGTEEWVLDLMTRTALQYEIDPDRIFVGGHSMGGYGTWCYGAHHADRFAAGVASAGAPSPVYSGGRIISIQKGIIPSLSALPLLVFQSTDDPKVGPDANQAAVKEIDKAKEQYGGFEDFTYWEVHDRGHGFPEGGAGALLDRIRDFERDTAPEKIVWQPALDWKTRFYWLEWTSPKIGAIVVAERKGNEIELDLRRTDGAGLSVLLSEDVVDFEKPVTVRVNGRRVFEGMVERDFRTWIETSHAGDPGHVYLARIPAGS